MAENEIKIVNKYNFEKNLSRMKSDFGSIPKGQEDDYSSELFSIEKELLKFYRKNPSINGSHALNAIRICLIEANGYLNGISFDYSQLVDPKSLELGKIIIDTVIPFANSDQLSTIKKKHDIQSPEGLRNYFTTPIKCLIRIAGSIEFWDKEWGIGGYFRFLHEQIGRIVNLDA